MTTTDPTSLTQEQAAAMLSNVSGLEIVAEWIAQDIAAGAPTNDDGTVNIFHYASWLVGVLHGS